MAEVADLCSNTNKVLDAVANGEIPALTVVKAALVLMGLSDDASCTEFARALAARAVASQSPVTVGKSTNPHRKAVNNNWPASRKDASQHFVTCLFWDSPRSEKYTLTGTFRLIAEEYRSPLTSSRLKASLATLFYTAEEAVAVLDFLAVASDPEKTEDQKPSEGHYDAHFKNMIMLYAWYFSKETSPTIFAQEESRQEEEAAIRAFAHLVVRGAPVSLQPFSGPKRSRSEVTAVGSEVAQGYAAPAGVASVQPVVVGAPAAAGSTLDTAHMLNLVLAQVRSLSGAHGNTGNAYNNNGGSLDSANNFHGGRYVNQAGGDQPRRKTYNCFNCGGGGHGYSECPKPVSMSLQKRLDSARPSRFFRGDSTRNVAASPAPTQSSMARPEGQ